MCSYLADKPSLANGTAPGELSIDTLNTGIPNLADEPTLANGPPVLTSSGQDEFKFGRSTPRSAGRYTPLVLTSSGPEWQFHIATDIYWSRMAIGRSTPSPSTDI